MKIKITLLSLLTLGQLWLFAADYSMNRNCLKAYDLILELRFNEADELLNNEKALNPTNKIILYLENYRDFLKIIISEEETTFNSLAPLKKARLAKMENASEESPWHLYCQAQINMQWAFARIKFGGYTTAAIELNRAYRQLTRNKDRFPGFHPNDAALGLLHVLIGSVPEKYKWITEALSVQGTVKQGTGEFQHILNNPGILIEYPFLKSESIFLLSFITLNFSATPEDSEHLMNLIEQPQNKALVVVNPLMIYAASACYLHLGRNDQALDLLLNRPRGSAYYPFHYLDYLTGIAKLNKLEPGARLYFLRYVVNFKGENFIKSAYQRLAWIELLNNNQSGYNDYMERVRLFGSDDLDSDIQALKDAENTNPPDITLLKARLLFDGGYYNEALVLLNNMNPGELAAPREKIEYIYRLARIYHKDANIREAIKYYAETLQQGAAYPFYFAANASLHLGNIYEAQGNNEKARYYYRRTLSLKYDEYNISISQKAKAGLSRLK